jgi:hypothetical protein
MARLFSMNNHGACLSLSDAMKIAPGYASLPARIVGKEVLIGIRRYLERNAIACTVWGDLFNRPVWGFVGLGNVRHSSVCGAICLIALIVASSDQERARVNNSRHSSVCGAIV